MHKHGIEAGGSEKEREKKGGREITKLIYCRCKSGISIENASERQVQKFKIIFKRLDAMATAAAIIRIFQ